MGGVLGAKKVQQRIIRKGRETQHKAPATMQRSDSTASTKANKVKKQPEKVIRKAQSDLKMPDLEGEVEGGTLQQKIRQQLSIGYADQIKTQAGPLPGNRLISPLETVRPSYGED